LLAAGHDMSQMLRSLRRIFRMPAGQVGMAMRALPVLAALAVVSLFAATLGWTVIFDQAGPLTARLLPDAGNSMMLALALFLGAVAAAILVLWLLGGLVLTFSRRSRGRSTSRPAADV